MSGPEHYEEAERLLRLATEENSADAGIRIGLAQVHATLAMAAASLAGVRDDAGFAVATDGDHDMWHSVTRSER